MGVQLSYWHPFHWPTVVTLQQQPHHPYGVGNREQGTPPGTVGRGDNWGNPRASHKTWADMTVPLRVRSISEVGRRDLFSRTAKGGYDGGLARLVVRTHHLALVCITVSLP